MRIAPLKPDFIHSESRIAHTTTEATKKKAKKTDDWVGSRDYIAHHSEMIVIHVLYRKQFVIV